MAHVLPHSLPSPMADITNQFLHPSLLCLDNLRILLKAASQDSPASQSEVAPRLKAVPIPGPSPFTCFQGKAPP